MDQVPTPQSHAPCVHASHADTDKACVAVSMAPALPHTGGTEAARMALLMQPRMPC